MNYQTEEEFLDTDIKEAWLERNVSKMSPADQKQIREWLGLEPDFNPYQAEMAVTVGDE